MFGCVCFVHVHHTPDKLSHRSIKCIFLGYSRMQKGYKCFEPIFRKSYVSVDVTFFKLLHTFQKNDHLWTLAIFYISSYSISSDSRADKLLQVCVCKKSRPQLNQEGDTTPSNSSAIQKTFSAIILL